LTCFPDRSVRPDARKLAYHHVANAKAVLQRSVLLLMVWQERARGNAQDVAFTQHTDQRVAFARDGHVPEAQGVHGVE
jgi:hypothetical protein